MDNISGLRTVFVLRKNYKFISLADFANPADFDES